MPRISLFVSRHALITVTRLSTMPDALASPSSPYPQQVDPSPTDSSGTESTDIEEDVQEETADSSTNTALQFSRPQSRTSVRTADSC